MRPPCFFSVSSPFFSFLEWDTTSCRDSLFFTSSPGEGLINHRNHIFSSLPLFFLFSMLHEEEKKYFLWILGITTSGHCLVYSIFWSYTPHVPTSNVNIILVKPSNYICCLLFYIVCTVHDLYPASKLSWGFRSLAVGIRILDRYSILII